MKTQKQTLPLLSDAKQDPDEFQADETQDEEFSGSNDSDELADPIKTSIGLYVGCFDNSNPFRQLRHRYKGHPAMIPEVFVKHCAIEGYLFAGLLLASECFCGYYFNDDEEVGNDRCKLPCQGDFQRSCGGPKDIAIYSTCSKKRLSQTKTKMTQCLPCKDHYKEKIRLKREDYRPNPCTQHCSSV
ncbi:sialate:O-sulfotransferase 1-like [Montipora foliosa]|uniref:sialate:O-sulfotransferase 1-like n=1 Tax=Montipora foliosa TaxID=591990 RepID=UPI0035F119F8